jgi:hypothetical protein
MDAVPMERINTAIRVRTAAFIPATLQQMNAFVKIRLLLPPA